MENFLTGLQNFKLEMFGNILISAYLAWFAWSTIGSVIATLVRNHLTTLKSYPINAVQMLLSLLVTFAFIRFSVELTNYVPNAFGAFIVGLGGNELALAMLKKYLNRKKAENEIQADIAGGGQPNPKDPKP